MKARVGGEKRRQKSLRIGVHHANAVVWGPVYRTHLKRRERLHPAHDVPEHRVLAVQVTRGFVQDEKLRSVRVRARVGHGQDAAAGVAEVRDLVL